MYYVLEQEIGMRHKVHSPKSIGSQGLASPYGLLKAAVVFTRLSTDLAFLVFCVLHMYSSPHNCHCRLHNQNQCSTQRL